MARCSPQDDHHEDNFDEDNNDEDYEDDLDGGDDDSAHPLCWAALNKPHNYAAAHIWARNISFWDE